ncbi:bifunctional aspartate kinase/homoserine dehydrogenase I [Robertkochia marina]|uniref:Bifunctional aspartate kinase/homoserine dehydrogenase I n=1 Tax=Robertkochia marina TaxID=1227945 RepID=A0A4S3M2L5_9FLAO|nr:bifunctional aspartate kinase/homoserine dehydrogenase I [Robertkochia marina]THD68919.1 bifunctional aspartate kinase/homoserine dehydrogenase I [Robertkochia marina]TRZ44926.1 bifunctional aspartate kinase/homoserine dehydrogenase I [Robertkochia marina]
MPELKEHLLQLEIKNFRTLSGTTRNVVLSYQIFGQPLGKAPVVMVNHALTGNSNVCGPEGWWNDLIGPGKCIDTSRYAILAFNIPGNGYDGILIEDYPNFVARDVARIFLEGLEQLGVKQLYALIGGSLGGGIAWEMAALAPEITRHLIPVASDWKSTDWLIANCQIQERILNNSSDPVHDARMHAMLCYRTPESFNERFGRSTNEELHVFNVESWLLHHGRKLQDRFQLGAYKLMNQLLKTIDITRDRAPHFGVLENIKANIHIIGVNSDLFFTAKENRDTYKRLAAASDRVGYGEINSVHGHDAFLIETDQLAQHIHEVFNPEATNKKPIVLKFGGKSLANGQGISNAVQIIKERIQEGNRIAIVVSARGEATDQLEALLEKSAAKQSYAADFEEFRSYQEALGAAEDLEPVFNRLEGLLSGVQLLGDYSAKVKDEVLAQGELLSGITLTKLLQEQGINARFADSRELIKTTEHFGNAQPIEHLSKENIINHFTVWNGTTVNVLTGFIGSNTRNETTTLGRNGSNFTAALVANYLDAGELQNYTHVDGIFTADPQWVPDAKRIAELSFNEANELANFGANILHAKTIIPLLEKNIPLRILNTFNPDSEGTLIKADPKQKGIRSLSVLDNVALINLEGRGLLGKSGVDARIFRALGKENISVSIISQGSSERGIGLVVNADRATDAVIALEQEFENDFYARDVNQVSVTDDVGVISIVGQDLSNFHHPYTTLIRNKVVPLLFNNTVTGKNVSLVLKQKDLHKAVNVIHGEIFGVSKAINIAVFGHGNVGAALIDQILNAAEKIEKRKKIKLNIFTVANSKKVLLQASGISNNWRQTMEAEGVAADAERVIRFAEEHHLGNLVAVDNTASSDFVKNYEAFIEAGFDLVSSNKIANTMPYGFYRRLRKALEKNQKQYLYETNVGAGLPLIDTIRLLHLSGENITRIRGIFSGTLSYLFNRFSSEDIPFSEVLKEAYEKGYTEPDPREDLSGNDVARKLLILARELDLKNEIEEVAVENLVPEYLQQLELPEFLKRLTAFDEHFQKLKAQQKPGHVLRFTGDLHGDLQRDKGILDVKLVSVPEGEALGQVKGADSIFEIYTESYGEHPVVIQGAGAGAEVTARGVFGDILKLSERNQL